MPRSGPGGGTQAGFREADRKNEPNQILLSDQGYQRSSWGGNVANPYDTTRAASLGSSSGSGASVSTNLVTCSICEETSMSCRGSANHNSVALILPHKAMVSFLGGAIGADIHNDRSGIHCRSITDSAKVLDALKDPVNGYYDPRDVFTTVPRAAVSNTPYAASAATPGTAGSLKGVRIGAIRESMLTFAGGRRADRAGGRARDQGRPGRAPRRDARRIDRPALAGRRSTPARSSGATSSARRGRTGRKWNTSWRRSASAKGWPNG